MDYSKINKEDRCYLIDNSDELYNLSKYIGWSAQETNKLAYDYFATHVCLGITSDGHIYYGGLGMHKPNPFDNGIKSVEDISELYTIVSQYNWTTDYTNKIVNDCFDNHFCGVQIDGTAHYWA
ncbi:MAG: hypothetical protein OEY79_04575 [Anaplasmataceae bacterium]|nr:hypothetical protein [Anaplasmataceae bacterium]